MNFPNPTVTPETVPDAGRFLVEAPVARLALRCHLGPSSTVPDLTVSSRNVVPPGRSAEDSLGVVQEVIGERVTRLITGVAAQAGLGQQTPQRVLILPDQERFVDSIESELVKRLGVAQKAENYPEFIAALAKNLYQWLEQHAESRKKLSAEFDGGRLYLLSPVLKRRPGRT